jgi:dienelactone hydrolase
LPDLFGGLRALAAHPRIDPQRLGVMGQSFGASMAVLAATEPVWRTYGQGGPPLRAALALYPGCFRFEPGGGSARFLTPGFPRVPLLLLVAEQDDYDADGGASCRTLMTRPSPEAQALAMLHIYPGATHGWDVTRPRTIQETGAARGQGGLVRMQRSPSTTEDSLRRTTAFFTEQLAAR